MGLAHADSDDAAGGGCEQGDRPDSRRGVDEVGDDAGDESTDGEPGVAPQAIDADGGGAPAGMGDVSDRAVELGINFLDTTDAYTASSHRQLTMAASIH